MENQEKPVHEIERLLYRPRTVAQMADLSVSQVYKLIENGTLKCVRIGKSVRVTAAAISEMIAEGSRVS